MGWQIALGGGDGVEERWNGMEVLKSHEKKGEEIIFAIFLWEKFRRSFFFLPAENECESLRPEVKYSRLLAASSGDEQQQR